MKLLKQCIVCERIYLCYIYNKTCPIEQCRGTLYSVKLNTKIIDDYG